MNWIRENVPPRTVAVVLIVSVFASPGHALDQQVAVRQQADEDPLEHRVLPGDHAADLEQGALEALPGLGGRGGGAVVGGRGHERPPWSRWLTTCSYKLTRLS